ncbi:MAG: ATP-binding protein [Fibromonadales bacterium]|nr:ATP-binding protein [Fibromonadales bacterium]
MERSLIKNLLGWKNSALRKPLILYGARQSGKTWLLKEFGKKAYEQTVYLNFDDEPELGDYFQKNLKPERIIGALESHFGLKITPSNTLIIFDEIQECQRAKDSLKFFNENAPQYHIAAAGSFLGVASGKFPVGQVDSLTLYPMSFHEFLEAIGRNMLLKNIEALDFPLLESLHTLLTDTLKTYFYVGGMPAAVKAFVQTNDLTIVRETQNEILRNYKNDFSKHISPHDISKVRMLWDSMPAHLAREKKKFIYKDVKSGGRASEFENALDWLVNTGLVYKILRTSNPKIPLARSQEREAFKLFMLDVGLLCAKSNIDLSLFYVSEPKIFDDFHGALTEQYVCQQIKSTTSNPLFYWGREKGDAEVDFIMQHKNTVIPIEVKSGKSTQSKSLNVYINEYNPKIAVRVSLKNYGKKGNLLSLPLYLLGYFNLAEC